MVKEYVKIDDWYIGFHNGSDILYGKVNNQLISSSSIININLQENQIETLRTIYKLGKKNKKNIDGQASLEDIKEILNK